MECEKTPVIEMTQKVFQLNHDARLVLLIMRKDNKPEVHIKLIDNLSGQQLCLTEDLLVEIIRESRKLWKVDIDYPCANVIKRIHVREEFGIYLIKYQKKKIILSWDAILEIEKNLGEILQTIRRVEIDHFLKITTTV